MKKFTVMTVALLLLTLPAFSAQLYRWVDEKGNVEWRDTPPPPNAKKVEQRNIDTGTTQTTSLPYSLQLAVKNFPVTLWVNNCGEVCDKARAHLNRRGVPHTEKDPQAHLDAFKKASGGDLALPLLFVGNSKLKGYLESDWDSALDIAGYPKTALVPVKPAMKPTVSAKPGTEAPKTPVDGSPTPAQ